MTFSHIRGNDVGNASRRCPERAVRSFNQKTSIQHHGDPLQKLLSLTLATSLLGAVNMNDAAASLAIDDATAVQEVDYEQLRTTLLDNGQILSTSSDQHTRSKVTI